MKNKFTLIEVLVVVAIIGILVSFLMPVLGKARDKSRASVCKNNLKQLATTMFIYHDDSERIIAHAHFPNPGPWSKRSNFPGDTSILECPSDDKADPEQWEPSYGFNYWNLHSQKLSEVKNPAETVFFADSGHKNTTHPWNNRPVAGYLINNKSAWAAPIGLRHNEAPNLLWVDGHVSTLKDMISIHLSDELWDKE
ncbi:type II secretion system protein [Lentisphaera marina]|uniref:type II secretion system protein n=1 Tax=Lentisphaera marina TaxID=1111041 RepID=UPI002366B4BD|nr:type II secretion system protein [Lentisphaera marina]MDD7985081.1 type II secretion system protein [Lentisphaera marina]